MIGSQPLSETLAFFFGFIRDNSMIVEKKASSSNHGVLGGRTARDCDNCLSNKASWFCVSDDAFLCHGCDALVHSANQLARRHERISLQVSSMAVQTSMATIQSSQPSSVHGFSRRTTTPKEKRKISTEKQGKEREIGEISYPVVPVVPEMGSDETLGDENEDDLLQRVPVFDFCSILNEADEDEHKFFISEEFDGFSASFLPSELDLADFVADVESLLEEDTGDFHFKNEIRNVKKEEEEEEKETRNNDYMQIALDFRINGEDEAAEKKLLLMADQTVVKDGNEDTQMETKMFLRLNYEDIISAWDGDCSLWTTGCRPELRLDNCSPDYYLGSRPREEDGGLCRKAGGFSGGGGGSCGEREARVSRYREKRRSRLFAKKIRYQVRKLNAEKRPRMKGRFVKRTA